MKNFPLDSLLLFSLEAGDIYVVITLVIVIIFFFFSFVCPLLDVFGEVLGFVLFLPALLVVRAILVMRDL